MRKHWRYLKYLLKHKWFVFCWCCRYGMPLVGIIHDWSKFLPDEWGPYAEKFYGEKQKPVRDESGYYDAANTGDAAFDVAWLKHQHRNPHHWQHWVLLLDSGEVRCLAMPHRYRREMLADWRGAGRAITGKDNVLEWYKKNRGKMQLHSTTRLWVEQEIGFQE